MARTTTAHTFEPGDEARYTARFLRSTGMYTHRPDDPTHGWAEVLRVSMLGPRNHLVHVRWSDGTERKVLSANLQRRHAPERAGVDFDPDPYCTVKPNPLQKASR